MVESLDGAGEWERVSESAGECWRVGENLRERKTVGGTSPLAVGSNMLERRWLGGLVLIWFYDVH